MIKYFSSLLLFYSVCITDADCQSRFSQFYSSPLSMNPANTGRFNKSYRVGGLFRREISALEQIETQTAFFADIKILGKIMPEIDCLGLGISILSEKNPTDGIKNTYLSVSLAYQKGLDEEGKQQLGLGFQGTIANRQLDKPNYIFESQLVSWINSGYTNLDIFQLAAVNVVYTDLNAGLIYQGMIDATNRFSAGVSMYHITYPRKIFQGGELNVPRQTWGHLAWEKKFRDRGKLYSALLMGYSERSVNNLFAGLICDISLNRNNQVSIGAWYRSNAIRGKAIVPVLGLSFLGFTIKTSYDINFYSKSHNQKSAMEISLIYTGAKNREQFLEDRFIRF